LSADGFRPGATLMVQGASSSVGKSLLVTAFCRIFARRGVRVAPFKAQNMSNNAAVCGDGGEIGRAQALQAIASGIEPTVDMNPILLKPEADHRSQVIIHGRPWRTMSAVDYYDRKRALWSVVAESLDRLKGSYELVIIEGAGSPAELNLRVSDVVNMAVARHANAPVALVGDIDRGGVFAQLLGTLWLLPEEEQRLIRGLIVNKFRGDPALFEEGVKILEERGNRPVLGVVPYLPGLGLPEEDAATLDVANADSTAAIDVVVVRLPHIANFDDFDPLRSEPGVGVRFVDSARAIGRPDAVILPGSKSTVADLDWLRASGLDDRIGRLAREGTAIVGICGGFQMLGRSILDPGGVESDRVTTPGLGLLPVATTFAPTKCTRRIRARIVAGSGWMAPLIGHELGGYEIHMGRSTEAGAPPWLSISREDGPGAGEPDGAASGDGRIWGCYVHGLFDDDRFRRAWLGSLGQETRPDHSGHHARFRAALDRLADEVERAVDIEALSAIIREHQP
jgi:adenosylcobyric acid synthase